MKVLIYDIGVPESGVEYPIKEAFEVIGHQANMFDWQRYLYTYGRADILSRIKDRALFKMTARRINKDLTTNIRENHYDMLLVVRGDHIYPETLTKAKKYVPFILNWNSDDVFNPLNSTQYMLRSLDRYDCIFSPRGHLKDEYLNKGAKSFEVLNWYYRYGLLSSPPTPDKNNFRYDIAFIGAWSRHRENIISSLESFDVKIWGWGWKKKVDRNFYAKSECMPQISMRDMMEVFAATKININILTKENRDTTNLRNFEIPAAGGFQISERSDEILQLFEEEKDIVCYESANELRSKCVYYLKNETQRHLIALNGYKRLISGNNSLVDRIKQIVSKVES